MDSNCCSYPESTSLYVVAYQQKSNTVTTIHGKFTHTHQVTEESSSQTGEASISWNEPLLIGYSYTVNKTTKDDNWEKADTYPITTN